MRAALRCALLVLGGLALATRALAQDTAPDTPTPPDPPPDAPTPTPVPDPPPADSSPDQMTRDRAELHLASARSHRAAGHPERALGDLVAAFELVHDGAILLEIARCHEELLQLPEALAAYESLADMDGVDPRLRARAEQRAATIRSRLAQLGVRPREREGPGEGEREAEEPAEEGMSTGRLVAHATTFGLAGLGLIVGGIFGILTVVEDGELRAGCGADSSCTGDDLEDIRIYRLAADIAFFASAIAALAGFLLVLTNDSGDEEEDEPAAQPSATVEPWVSPEGAGVLARGRF